MEKDNYQNLYDYSLRLLSYRPRSTGEIQKKLKRYSQRRNFPDSLADKVIKALTQQKFLDDREFVRWWVEQRQLSRPKGMRVIKMELVSRGIDKETIDSVLSESSEELADEYDLAMRVVNKKMITFKNLPKEKLKIKIRDLLLRRGFDWDTVGKVIDYLSRKE